MNQDTSDKTAVGFVESITKRLGIPLTVALFFIPVVATIGSIVISSWPKDEKKNATVEEKEDRRSFIHEDISRLGRFRHLDYLDLV